MKPERETALWRAVVNQGLKQRWIAEQLGMDYRKLSDVLLGKLPATKDQACGLSKILRIPQ